MTGKDVTSQRNSANGPFKIQILATIRTNYNQNKIQDGQLNYYIEMKKRKGLPMWKLHSIVLATFYEM